MRDRADVVAALQDAGLEVPRQGKDYLTALDPETGDRWRLKGELYAFDFERERLDRAAAETAGERTPGDRGDDRGELEGLAENSRRVARNALRTIERDTEQATGRMRALLVKAWLRPLIVGLSLWLGIFGGSWATMRWLSRSIQARFEMAAGLDRDIEEARRTLAQLEVDTWGIVLHEIKGERVVVVPDGALADPPWEGGRPSGLEAVEQVRELYDRVRGAVDEGLAEVVRAVRDGTAAALRAGRSLADANRAARRASDTLGRVATARSPQSCAYPDGDAPARAGARSGSEPLMGPVRLAARGWYRREHVYGNREQQPGPSRRRRPSETTAELRVVGACGTVGHRSVPVSPRPAARAPVIAHRVPPPRRRRIQRDLGGRVSAAETSAPATPYR